MLLIGKWFVDVGGMFSHSVFGEHVLGHGLIVNEFTVFEHWILENLQRM